MLAFPGPSSLTLAEWVRPVQRFASIPVVQEGNAGDNVKNEPPLVAAVEYKNRRVNVPVIIHGA